MTALSNARSYDRPSGRRRGRSLAALALVAVVGLVASSCSSGEAWIARIDGTPIESPHFWEGVPYFAGYVSAIQQAPPPTTVVEGVSDNVMAGSYAVFLVRFEAMKKLNAKHGTKVSQADIDGARQGFTQAPFDEYPSWFIDQLASIQAHFTALQAFYAKGADTDKDVRDYYEKNKDQFRQACIDVTPSPDEAELVAARKSIEDGADFATVAKAVAAAQPPGPDGTKVAAEGENQDGYVGCWGAANLSRLFATPAELDLLLGAEPDELVGPLPIAGGAFALFKVRSTGHQPLDEVRQSIQSSLGDPGQQKAANAVSDFLAEAHVELNPRVGTWNSDVASWNVLGPVIPPVGAEQPPGQSSVPLELSSTSG